MKWHIWNNIYVSKNPHGNFILLQLHNVYHSESAMALNPLQLLSNPVVFVFLGFWSLVYVVYN